MKPSRCTPYTASLIDHIVTNSRASVFETAILVSKLSDHFPIVFFIKNQKTSNNPNFITYQNFSEEAISGFKNNLKNINWNFLNTNDSVQKQYDDFSDVFFSLYNISFPPIRKSINRNNHSYNPWMTKGLLISRTTKIKLCKLSFLYPFEPHISNYKIYRNLYASILRTSKKIHYQHALTKYQADAKKTWQILRKAINNTMKKSNSIQEIVINGLSITDPLIIANNFNKFFTTVAEDVAKSIHPPNPPYIEQNLAPNTPRFQFSDNQITEVEVREAMSQLKCKKSADFNGISSHFLKKIIDELAHPLSLIFNRSLVTGLVPSQLKVAKVIPIFKSGISTSMDNYRPISLLSQFSKILEKNCMHSAH